MQNKTNNQVYAGFFVRLAAFLVDMIIVNAGLLVVRIPMWILAIGHPDQFLVRDLIFKYSIADMVVYGLTVLYFVLMTYHSGATLGKKLFHIRVISTEYRDMTLFEVVFRETIGRFLSAVVMQIGYLLIMVEKDKRGLHDLLSDTCVVYYHEKKVYVHVPVTYRNMVPGQAQQMTQEQLLQAQRQQQAYSQAHPMQPMAQQNTQAIQPMAQNTQAAQPVAQQNTQTLQPVAQNTQATQSVNATDTVNPQSAQSGEQDVQ